MSKDDHSEGLSLKTLIDSIPELAWTARSDGFIDFYNRRWYDYTGTTPEQMKGWGWTTVHDPEMLASVMERWKRSLETGDAFEMEFRLRGGDGVFRWFLTRVAPLRAPNGEIVRWFGTNTNVDEFRMLREDLASSYEREKVARKEIEVALSDARRESERAAALAAKLAATTERLHAAQRAGKIGLFDWDLTRNALSWSDELYRLMGLEPNAVAPSSERWTRALLEEDREKGWRAFRDATTAGETFFEVEVRLLQPAGEPRWVRLSTQLEYDVMGNPSRILGAVVDIQSLAIAREEARYERDRFRSLLDQLPVTVSFLIGDELVVEYASPNTIRALAGRKIEGKPLLEAVPEHRGQPFVDRILHVLKSGEIHEQREILVPIDRLEGRREDTYWTSIYQPIRRRDGTIEGVMTFDQDVTEARRQAGEKLRLLAIENTTLADRARAQEFQERFLAILGHDLRNPLAAMEMARGLLSRRPAVQSDPGSLRLLERMESSSRRISRMIAQILDLTRSRLAGGLSVRSESMDLGRTLTSIADEMRTANPSRTIELHAPATIMGTWDADRLEQVFSNLIGNAVGHGVATSAVTVTATVKDGRVKVDVHNDGPPIPDELRERLFDPFRRGERDSRTTKTAGLGLGLYISREIVAAHGGSIEVDSSSAEGTTFRVTLPCPHP